jgi:hypothetical protein
MAETEKPKAGRRQKRREEEQAKRARTGDTPEATAEHSKGPKQEYDPDKLEQLGQRTGVFG